MPIFNSIFSWWMKKRAHQIELFLKYPIEVQNERFEELITTAKNTEFGKKIQIQLVRHNSAIQRNGSRSRL